MAGKVSNFAPSTPWIAEDDLLLKNSIEAGASFEALAKGAVKFSRAFTVRELRERWHSLLYDPDVAMQASSRMLELELSGFNSSSMFGRLDNVKSAGVASKRKSLSIRRQYNAMRKRLRTELYDSSDAGLVESSQRDCKGNAGAVLDSGSGGANYMLRDCMSDRFELHDSDFDILHRVVPQQTEDIGSASSVEHPVNVYETQCENITDNDHSVTKVREDNFYGFPGNIAPTVLDDARGSLESNVDGEVASDMMLHTYSNTPDPLQELPNINHFVADSDGSALLHAMGFSSQMPRLPLWKTMEDVSVPAMPVPMNEGDRTHVVEEASQLPDNYQKRGETPSGFDVNSEPLIRDRESGKCYNSEAVCNTVSEGEFSELSYSLLNFLNADELLSMNVDGKDTMDSTSYENVNSLVVSSASAAQEGASCNIHPNNLHNIEPFTTLVSETCPNMESKNSVPSLDGDVQHNTLHSEINVASSSMLNFNSSQLNEENVSCILNAEDREIPCNDDIFLLIHPTSPVRKPFTIAPVDPPSSADKKDNERGVSLRERVKDPALSYEFSSALGPTKLPESYPGLPLAGCKVKSEVPDPLCFNLNPGDVNKTTRYLSQSRSIGATSVIVADGVVEEGVKVEPLVLHNPSASREMALPAEAGSVKMALSEIVDNPSASDQDESESENDVPYFSDIEAMILEMDLAPHDQDSYTSRHGIKYEDEDARKKIIRLEQCARSSLQRKMTSHGALAFLYGRRLKCFMKKTEVLLGRSTDDVDVDIDLRKEGPANKISRRQATITMKADGSFVLKNLGRSSISVNGKAIANEQSLSLSSSSLIEIKGMSFLFEINQKYVRRYLDTFVKKTA